MVLDSNRIWLVFGFWAGARRSAYPFVIGAGTFCSCCSPSWAWYSVARSSSAYDSAYPDSHSDFGFGGGYVGNRLTMCRHFGIGAVLVDLLILYLLGYLHK